MCFLRRVKIGILNSLILIAAPVFAFAEEVKNNTVFGIDMSIEGLRSQKFSQGIFVFLIVSLILFSIIVYVYLPKNKKSLKTGEKVMFGAIIMGMILAIVIGWIQLIEGYLI